MKSCGNCANYDRTKMEHTEVCGKCVTVYGDVQKEPSKWTSLPQTNADRIRAMSDEELEVFLINVDLGKDGSPFITDWGKWLKQPSE